MTGIVVGLLLVAAAVAVVAYPLWRPTLRPLSPEAEMDRLSELRERKEIVYAMIRELGLDFRAGKLTEEDYRQEVDRLKSEAVEVVKAIEETRSRPPRGPEDLESEIAAIRRRIESAAEEPETETATGTEVGEAGTSAGPFCTQCGRRAGPDDRFCAGCGARLVEPADSRP